MWGGFFPTLADSIFLLPDIFQLSHVASWQVLSTLGHTIPVPPLKAPSPGDIMATSVFLNHVWVGIILTMLALH